LGRYNAKGFGSLGIEPHSPVLMVMNYIISFFLYTAWWIDIFCEAEFEICSSHIYGVFLWCFALSNGCRQFSSSLRDQVGGTPIIYFCVLRTPFQKALCKNLETAKKIWATTN